jgi:hypothetical protein
MLPTFKQPYWVSQTNMIILYFNTIHYCCLEFFLILHLLKRKGHGESINKDFFY